MRIGWNKCGIQDELCDLPVLPCEFRPMIPTCPLGKLGTSFIKTPYYTASIQHHHVILVPNVYRKTLHIVSRNSTDSTRKRVRCNGDIEARQAELQDTTNVRHNSVYQTGITHIHA